MLPKVEVTIDKVYIYESFALLIRRSIDKLYAESAGTILHNIKLLAEDFLQSGHFWAHLYSKHWSREILGPNRTVRGLRFDIVSLKSGSHDPLFSNNQAKHLLRL